MSATTAYLADGTLLYSDITTPGTPVELVDVKDISSPEPKFGVTDITALANGLTRRVKKRGLAEPAEWTFKQFWTKARWTLLKTAEAAGTAVGWKITYPDNATPVNATNDTFTGFITSCTKDPISDNDAPIFINVTVQINSAITNTPGS
jgi:hypothetical protein